MGWCIGGEDLSCKEGLVGIVPPDVVWNGISEKNILETAIEDLEVVIWVTPCTKTVKSGTVEDRCMVEVRSIYFCVRAENECFRCKTLPWVQSQ